ncbi:MAG: septum formation protein Maf [Paraprevotella sp.]|nr:septum formation protein Maf [Paraprevotella sp.]
MLDNLKSYRIILASNSPRRQELLAGLGLSFTVKVLPDIDESYPENLQRDEIPQYISRSKANAYRSIMQEQDLIITADTIVWVEGEVLGKPKNQSEAMEMLRKLSGRTHQVVTGVTLTTKDKQTSFATVSDVAFTQLDEDEIQYYVEHYRPMDKAGAYGVQEWIGFVGVESLSGSYFNVMGLPVQRLYHELKKM